jgi:hypothetical protein
VTIYEFDLVLSGLDLDADTSALANFEDEIDDITFAAHGSTVSAAVERSDRSLAEAVRSAIADVERLPNVRVERVLPDGLVSQAEIAVRTGRTRQSVSQLVKGIRGPGGFPDPPFGTGRAALWRWSDVVEWLVEAKLLDARKVDEHQRVIDAANAMLDARKVVTGLSTEDQVTIRKLVA